MSTHADAETRPAPTTDRTAETAPTTEGDDGPTAESPAPIAPFDTHDSAARFGETTDRLPNTADGENEYVG